MHWSRIAQGRFLALSLGPSLARCRDTRAAATDMNVKHDLRRLVALRLPHQDDGQGLVEYALIIMLIALALVASVGAFGNSVKALYDYIIEELPFV